MKFGTAQPRLEDPRLLRGEGRYADDVPVEGALHMAILRSPFAAGRIAALDVSGARAMPGVRLVLTAADMHARGLRPFAVRFAPPGTQPAPTPFYPLAWDAVRYEGEPVVAVVGETRAQALDACEAILFDVEDAQPVVDAAGASDPGAPEVWPGRANTVFTCRLGGHDAVARAIKGAAHVVSQRLSITRVTAVAMEPRNALAVPGTDGGLTLHTGTQAAHRVRDEIASVLGLDPAGLRVLVQDVGGSFGMRNGAYPEDVLLVWAAGALGRPVR